MSALSEQQPTLGRWGIRRALLALHRDLFTIHRHARSWAGAYPPELTQLELMVLALEDRRFMRHPGVDLISGLREIVRAMTLQRHGGASTIDMQFVRTATGYKEKKIFRKLYEILLSVIIQYRYSKIVILRSYLSCAFFGSRLKGADSAAQNLYGIVADELNIDQASFVAAMLVYPRPLLETPAWLAKVQRRANYGVRIYVANKERLSKLPR